jgi:CO dehydrogenase maturation factor
MKISISGKGGSGKSTTTSLLALELKRRGFHPVVIDADESNSVIYRMLGLEKPPLPLVSLAGGRQMVRQLMPPGYKPREVAEDGTNILTLAKLRLSEIPPENIATKDNLSLIVIGKIVEALEGCACPMGVLGREFLSKLNLGEKEIAITDMEAGIEHFGRGFESSLDRVLIIVEPSFESLSLAERIRHLSAGIGIENVQAIVNKASSESLAIKLREKISQRGVSVLGSIPYDESVFSADLEGSALSLGSGRVALAMTQIVDALLSQ